ncbi:MAG: DUF1273 domain-containing protein [Ruminococcaceae bacterium]|nr:DUF1273 domain-containing protein [Oscillospiraceae bacterium]
MKEKTCSFTGHRSIKTLSLIELKIKLKKTVISLIEEGYDTFVTGGAIGFDTLAAKEILKLKKDYPHISLHLVLPCENQDLKWSDKQKEEYRKILDFADSAEYVSRNYTSTCMLDRNRRMIELSSVCIAYYDGRKRSGTQMTINYATRSGVKVINLY